MGLDAFVNCNCFKEGKTTKPPIEKNLIIIDEEGFYNIDMPDSEECFNRYLELTKWMGKCCSHTDMRYANERVGSWSMVAFFKETLKKIGEAHFPVLLNSIPRCNGGTLSVGLAVKALDELEYLKENVAKCSGVSLIEEKTGAKLYDYIASYGGEFIWSGKEKKTCGFDEKGFFIFDDIKKAEIFRSMHFTIREKDYKVYEYWDKDNKIRAIVNSMVPDVNLPAELRVIKRELNVEDISFTFEALNKLLKASIETGNPIVWT